MSIELHRAPTEEEVEAICSAAEEAAMKTLLTHMPAKRIRDIDVVVEAMGDKPLTLDVEVCIDLIYGDESLEKLVEEASDRAVEAAERKVRELKLCD